MNDLRQTSLTNIEIRARWKQYDKKRLIVPIRNASNRFLTHFNELQAAVVRVYDEDEERTTVNDDLLQLVLVQLTVNTVYKLYLWSSQVRRIVNKEQFWRQLIVRDYGLVPLFEVSLKVSPLEVPLKVSPLEVSLKVYYLRRNNLAIAGDLYRSLGFGNYEVSNTGVTALIGNNIVFSSRKIYHGHRGRNPLLTLEKGEYIISTYGDRIVTNKGNGYELDATVKKVQYPPKTIQLSKGDSSLDSNGKITNYTAHRGPVLMFVWDTDALLLNTGQLYRYNHTNDQWELIDTAVVYLSHYGYIKADGSLYLDVSEDPTVSTYELTSIKDNIYLFDDTYYINDRLELHLIKKIENVIERDPLVGVVQQHKAYVRLLK